MPESFGSSKDWEDLWSERRPDKNLQLKDALSKSSSSSDEEEESFQEEGNHAAAFLKGLKKGQGQPAKREEKEKKKKRTRRILKQNRNLPRLARKPKLRRINWPERKKLMQNGTKR